MGIEIERKFLVDKDKLLMSDVSSRITQGYLSDNDKNSIRVRMQDDFAFLTIKNAQESLKRHEFEYEIQLADAKWIIDNLCLHHIIEKERYDVCLDNNNWVVDVFDGLNKGLVLAEIELMKVDYTIDLPEWIMEEVTGKKKYYNRNLAKFPYSTWNAL